MRLKLTATQNIGNVSPTTPTGEWMLPTGVRSRSRSRSRSRRSRGSWPGAGAAQFATAPAPNFFAPEKRIYFFVPRSENDRVLIPGFRIPVDPPDSDLVLVARIETRFVS